MDIESKIHSAEGLCDEGKFEEARVLLAEVLEEDPKRSDVWRLVAQIDLNIGKDVDKAYDEVIEALRLDPKNLWALILMGNLLLGQKKDPETARSYFEKVLEYYPDNATALCNVGSSYAKQDEYADALIYYHSALKADPDYPVAWFSMAACLYNMGEYQKAFDACMEGSGHYTRRPEDKDVEKKLTQVYFNAATKLVQSADYSKVRERIIDELQKVDHLPIRYREDHTLHLSASMEYGPTHGRLANVIVYNPEKPFFDHLCVHELMHLKMLQRNTLAGKGK